ncbi:PREDICTED: uncharacterized protein LOC106106246 isoform X1 [Papilio polytes]|uniref:uncharacterized protein LOC106106246 isoform X1 n=1 Tax=Papilio polytes TaxID=76194 RepID=UPI000675F5D1|nr:PREDICTED: uncharacterized protein LOC106106246 isoform X1 [Papilio polytes]
MTVYIPVLFLSLIQSALGQWWWVTVDPLESEFTWVKDDPHFDCIVPITYYKRILNCGTFIRNNMIATTAIPLEEVFKWPTYIKVYMIQTRYNNSKGVYAIHSVGDIWGKQYFWVFWGYKRYERNPVHDLMFLYVSNTFGKTPNPAKRTPFYVPIAKQYAIEEPSGWKTAAFSLTDWRHVKHSTKLVPIYWDEPVLVDCQEYIPKYWGYFICILNIDKYPVIQSGAPLIQNNRLWGVASFSLRRGKESIYAYTDLRPYRHMIYGFYKKFFATTPKPWPQLTIPPWLGK